MLCQVPENLVLGNPPVDCPQDQNWVEYSMNFPKPLLGICDQVCDPLGTRPVGWPTHHYQLLSLLYNYNTDWNSSQLSCWRLLEFPQWNFVDPFSIDEPHTFDRRPGGRRLQFRRKKDSRNSSSSWLTRLEFQIFASK